ncbi:16642_t:CDS:2, partial [Racocetra persica]
PNEKKVALEKNYFQNVAKRFLVYGKIKSHQVSKSGQICRVFIITEQESKQIVISLIAKSSDEKQFSPRYEKWLAEYELLGESAQKSLNGYRRLVQKDSDSLRKGSERQEEGNKQITVLEEKVRERILTLHD